MGDNVLVAHVGRLMFYKFSFVLFLIQNEIDNVAPSGAWFPCQRGILSDASGGCITSIRANDYVRRGLSTTDVCPRCLLSTPVGIDSARGGFDFTQGGFDFTAVGLTSTEK